MSLTVAGDEFRFQLSARPGTLTSLFFANSVDKFGFCTLRERISHRTMRMELDLMLLSLAHSVFD
jgi:hypothetical protein